MSDFFPHISCLSTTPSSNDLALTINTVYPKRRKVYCFYSCFHFSIFFFFLMFQLASVTISVVLRTSFSHCVRACALVTHSLSSFTQNAFVSPSFPEDVFTKSEVPVERPHLAALTGGANSVWLTQFLVGIQACFGYLSFRCSEMCLLLLSVSSLVPAF